MEVKYAFFISCFIAPFSTSSLVYTAVFLFDVLLLFKGLLYYMALYGHFLISAFILMLLTNCCHVNLFWGSAFHMFYKCLELSKADFFCEQIRYFVVTKFLIFSFLLLVLIVLLVVGCSCLDFKTKPRHVEESIYIGRNSYFFHNTVISIYVLWLNGMKKMKNISLLLFYF